MKAYTSIEQSKKLAEILPIESADMSYVWFVIGKEYSSIPQCRKFIDDELPCWSLAALLEQLPYEVADEEGNSYNFQMNKDDDLYQIIYHDRWGYLEDLETESYEDFIDACYEMILKLHEQKLL